MITGIASFFAAWFFAMAVINAIKTGATAFNTLADRKQRQKLAAYCGFMSLMFFLIVCWRLS